MRRDILALLACCLLPVAWALAGPKLWTDEPTGKGTGNRVESSYAVINTSAVDTSLVAAVTGFKIRVLNYTAICSDVATIRFESGAGGTALTGQMPCVASSGVSPPCGQEGCFETASGALLNLEVSTGLSAGHLTYLLVPG